MPQSQCPVPVPAILIQACARPGADKTHEACHPRSTMTLARQTIRVLLLNIISVAVVSVLILHTLHTSK